ncbi:hypothetical protein I541_1038 [Mycobacteroides abscessus]|nr:hypothetical protein L836_2303 [Mycobacteroides abscessus MAB_110811_2726]EUA84248.1 hypothetical protein I541_1038 [Mycobacteroides abscessus]
MAEVVTVFIACGIPPPGFRFDRLVQPVNDPKEPPPAPIV